MWSRWETEREREKASTAFLEKARGGQKRGGVLLKYRPPLNFARSAQQAAALPGAPCLSGVLAPPPGLPSSRFRTPPPPGAAGLLTQPEGKLKGRSAARLARLPGDVARGAALFTSLARSRLALKGARGRAAEDFSRQRREQSGAKFPSGFLLRRELESP